MVIYLTDNSLGHYLFTNLSSSIQTYLPRKNQLFLILPIVFYFINTKIPSVKYSKWVVKVTFNAHFQQAKMNRT